MKWGERESNSSSKAVDEESQQQQQRQSAAAAAAEGKRRASESVGHTDWQRTCRALAVSAGDDLIKAARGIFIPSR